MPVIPAKAGIQSVDRPFPKGCGVDSRFRGNDYGLDGPSLANNINTLSAPFSFLLMSREGFGECKPKRLNYLSKDAILSLFTVKRTIVGLKPNLQI